MADRPRRDFDPDRPRRQGSDRPRRDFDRPRRGGSDGPRQSGFDRPRQGGFDRPRPGGFDRPRRDFDRDRPRRDFDRDRPRDDRPPGGGAGGARERSFGPARDRPYDRPRPGGFDRSAGSRPADRYGPRPPYRPAAGPRPPSAPRPDLVGEGEELVAGRRPVTEAFAARRVARRLVVVPERRAALESIVLHATTLRIPIVEVEGGTLTSLTGFDGHQGVALVVAQRRPASVEDMLARARALGEEPFVLILDSLEDPQNLGTLLRSAEACGVHGIIYPTRHAAPLTAAAVKTSAGASEHLLLAPVENLPATMADLRSAGMRLVGADEGAGMRYSEADLRGPLALVVGSEERGISGALRRRLDMTVRIPMRGRVASLNAAVAGSVLLFAAAEQRDVPESGERAVIDEPAPIAADQLQAEESQPLERDEPVPPVAASSEPADEIAPTTDGTSVSDAPAAADGADLLPGGPAVEQSAGHASGPTVEAPADDAPADDAPADDVGAQPRAKSRSGRTRKRTAKD